MKLAATLLALALATTQPLLAEGGHDVQKKKDAPKGLRGNAAKADSSLKRATVGRKLDFGYSPTTDPRACKDETGGKGPYPAICDICTYTEDSGHTPAGPPIYGNMNLHRLVVVPSEVGSGVIVADCSPTGANCTHCGGDIDLTTGETWLVGCCNHAP